MATEVVDVPEQSRYEIRRDGERLGVAAYDRDGDVVTLTHTEVDDGHEGEGVGSSLVRGALDDLRGRGLRVIPQCPFVASWLDRHPDYADLRV